MGPRLTWKFLVIRLIARGNDDECLHDGTHSTMYDIGVNNRPLLVKAMPHLIGESHAVPPVP